MRGTCTIPANPWLKSAGKSLSRSRGPHQGHGGRSRSTNGLSSKTRREARRTPPGRQGGVSGQVHSAETGVAGRLRALIEAPKSIRSVHGDKALSWVQNQLSIRLADRQTEAVRCAIEHKVMVVTGGPGTGKTTLINAVLRIFERLGIGIMLAAPTGRAAKRMAETTGHEARTIHRMLEYSIRRAASRKTMSILWTAI